MELKRKLYLLPIPALVLLEVSWLVLNKFRSALYDSGINDPHSTYQKVVAIQQIITWVVVPLLPIALVVLVYEVVHQIHARLAK